MDDALAERILSQFRQVGHAVPQPRSTNGDVELCASDSEIVARDTGEIALTLRDQKPHRLPCENQTFLHNYDRSFQSVIMMYGRTCERTSCAWPAKSRCAGFVWLTVEEEPQELSIILANKYC